MDQAFQKILKDQEVSESFENCFPQNFQQTMFSLSTVASSLHEIKYKGHSQDANKIRGKAKCFISIKVHTKLHRAQTMSTKCFNINMLAETLNRT